MAATNVVFDSESIFRRRRRCRRRRCRRRRLLLQLFCLFCA